MSVYVSLCDLDIPGDHPGFMISTILAIFDVIHVTPMTSYYVWCLLAFGFRRRSEKRIFKMAAMAAILDFR